MTSESASYLPRIAATGGTGTAHRVSGPAELLQAVPYLLGFHPARSLVLVGLADRRVVVNARIDLDDAGEVVPRTVPAMVNGGVGEFVVALYDDDADPTVPFEPLPWHAEALAAAEVIEGSGCELVDVLLVARGRWWSYVCDVPECCPLEGAPLPDAPSAFAAAATVAGVVVLPDRASVAALLDPEPGREALVADLAAAEYGAYGAVARMVRGSGATGTSPLARKRALFAAARASDALEWPGLDDAELIRHAVTLRSIDIRDAVWLAVDAARLDGRPLWRQLARRMPAPYDATPLFLFAWRSWRLGDGTLARIAAERALDADPGLSAAELLLTALSAGFNPRALPLLRSRPIRARRRAGEPGSAAPTAR